MSERNGRLTSSLEEPCWNCGGSNFTNNNGGHHMGKQLICADCYEPQEDDNDFYDEEFF